MSVDIKSVGELLTVMLYGEIDHHAAKDIREKIDEAIEFNMPSLVIMDFGGVTFMDSSGIGVIMGRYRLMQSVGGSVSAFGVSPRLDKLIEMSGIKRIVQIYTDEAAALKN